MAPDKNARLAFVGIHNTSFPFVLLYVAPFQRNTLPGAVELALSRHLCQGVISPEKLFFMQI
jgi:hypothetical protein